MRSLLRLSAFVLILATIFFYTASKIIDSPQSSEIKKAANRYAMANNGEYNDGNSNHSIYGTNANMYSSSRTNTIKPEPTNEKYEISLNNYPQWLSVTGTIFSNSR